MSPSTQTNDHAVTPAEGSLLPTPLKAGAFWAAVILPFLALGLLASGMETTIEFTAFALIVVANIVTLVIGHDYRQ